jgi:hypothetical protein
MGSDSNALRLTLTNATANAGNVTIKLEVRGGDGSTFYGVGTPISTSEEYGPLTMTAGDVVVFDIAGAPIMTGDVVRVYFKASSNAASATLAIDAMSCKLDSAETVSSVATTALDSTTLSNRVSEIDPISSHYVSGTLADVTNGADGTYYYQISMASHRLTGFQFELSGGSGTITITVEARVTADNSWVDVTNDTFGSASYTADDEAVDSAQRLAGFSDVRLKAVAATGAADDADWLLTYRSLY